MYTDFWTMGNVVQILIIKRLYKNIVTMCFWYFLTGVWTNYETLCITFSKLDYGSCTHYTDTKKNIIVKSIHSSLCSESINGY